MKKSIFVGISLLSIGICVDDMWGVSARLRKYTRTYSGNYANQNYRNSVGMGNARNIFSRMRLEENVSNILKEVVDKVPSKDIRGLAHNMRALSLRIPKKNGAEDVKAIVNKMNEAASCFEKLQQVRSNLYMELFNQSENVTDLPSSVDIDKILERLNQINMNKLGVIISICSRNQSLRIVTENLKNFSNRIKESKKILEEIKEKFSQTVLAQIEGIPELKNLGYTNTPSNRKLAELRDKDEESQIYGENSSVDDFGYGSGYLSDDEMVSQGTSTSQQNVEQLEIGSNSGSMVLHTTAGQQSGTNGSSGNTGSQWTPAQQNTEQMVGGNDSGVSSQEVPTSQQNVEQLEIGSNSGSMVLHTTAGQQSGTNGSSGNASYQWTPAQQNTEQTVVENDPGVSSQEVPMSQQNVEQSEIENSSDVNINNKESPEEFYKFLRTNIELLNKNNLTNKQKTAYDKIVRYLEETKSKKNFEQRVSEVALIIKAYNSLIALRPKTKDGKNLFTVSRKKVKSLCNIIYLEIFDDLKSRMEKLKLDKRFEKFKIDFDGFVALNNENKANFEKSDSGRDKRKFMNNSANAYDRLIEKIWKEEPKLVNVVDRIGYTLDTVISSIDVN